MTDWIRANKSSKCPICNKEQWCLIAKDMSAVICPRVEEGSKKYIEGSGYLHILKPGEYKRANPEWKQELPEHNTVLAQLAKKQIKARAEDKLDLVASDLQVPADTLKRLYMGWSGTHNGATFPMFRHKRRVIGIRIRTMTGKKFAVKGSRQGLFLPEGWDNNPKNGVLVCEGPTDTAAALSLGFDAIGRPSCLGGTHLISEAVSGRRVAIIADDDGPGMDGARRLQKHLDKLCPSCKIVVPPCSDMREWVRSGVTKQEVVDVIRQ
jgi:5S rRNA maturation endonuclease (ribonuclease M5)|tara:strand:+ start:147 stop:944 length:798 start_codon:yes stop_codon:yes gene_type:complete